MNERLEDELRSLRAEPRAAAYDEIDQQVWRRIDGVRRARSAAPILYAVRTAAVVSALGLGIATGGATAAALAAYPQEVSAFSVRADLAPSTLLDHHE
jgi:hypothetical protein